MKKILLLPLGFMSVAFSVEASVLTINNMTQGGLITGVVHVCYDLVSNSGIDLGYDCKYSETQVPTSFFRSNAATISINILDTPNAIAPVGGSWLTTKAPFVYIPYQFVWAITSNGRATPMTAWQGGPNSPCGVILDGTQTIQISSTSTPQLLCGTNTSRS